MHTEGVTKITLEDVDFADVWGGVIKLIGSVKMLENGQVHIMVCPMLVQRGSQLASVDDVFNGIMVRGDATGDVVFYGKGAGKLPTAKRRRGGCDRLREAFQGPQIPLLGGRKARLCGGFRRDGHERLRARGGGKRR